jgi:hypothetical protein
MPDMRSFSAWCYIAQFEAGNLRPERAFKRAATIVCLNSTPDNNSINGALLNVNDVNSPILRGVIAASLGSLWLKVCIALRAALRSSNRRPDCAGGKAGQATAQERSDKEEQRDPGHFET